MSYSIPPAPNPVSGLPGANDPVLRQYRQETHSGGWPRIYPYDTFRRRVREA